MSATAPNALIDRHALRQRLRRAQMRKMSGELPHPLQAQINDDIVDRLSAVLRRFERALVLSPWPTDLADKVLHLDHVDHATDASVLAGPAQVLVDDEALPLAPQTLDLLISVLALQATNDLPGALVQAQRTLQPDGLFIGVLFAGQTLHELRVSLLEAEAECSGGVSPRILPFADVRALGGLMQRAGFALPVADVDTVRMTYATPFQLLRELQEYGASNMLQDRARTILPRRTLMRAMEIYSERFSTPDGRIVATVDLVTLTGWAPSPDQQQPLKPGSARTRLADALNVSERPLGQG